MTDKELCHSVQHIHKVLLLKLLLIHLLPLIHNLPKIRIHNLLVYHNIQCRSLNNLHINKEADNLEAGIKSLNQIKEVTKVSSIRLNT